MVYFLLFVSTPDAPHFLLVPRKRRSPTDATIQHTGFGRALDVPFLEKKKKKKKTSVGPESKGLSENNVLESLDLSRSTFSGPSLRTLTQGLHKNKWLSCLKLVRCDLTDENIFGLLSRALLDHPKHSNCSYRSAGKI